MKKKIFAAAIILTLLGSSYYINEKEEKKTRIENVNREIQELFEPIIQNITFTIGENKYVLVMDYGRFHVNEEDYFKKLDGEAIIHFSVYENEVNDENLIGSGSYTPDIKRDSLEDKFYIDNNSRKMSHIAKLFSEFVSVYYEYIYSLSNEGDYDDRNGHGSYEEELEFDKHGKLIKEGYINYYQTESTKNLDMVFAAISFIDPDKEKLNIDIDTVNLQEEFKKIYLTNEQAKNNDEEIILYYSEDKRSWIDPLVIKKNNELESICLESTSPIPAISPDKKRIAYIHPYEWEEIGELYIYNIDKGIAEIAITREDIADQNTVKVAKWLDDRYILTIIGYAYGTVRVGGDLYIYDTKDDDLRLAMKAESIDKIKPEGFVEIMDFDIMNDYITLKLAKHDEEFMEYIVEDKKIKKDDIVSY